MINKKTKIFSISIILFLIINIIFITSVYGEVYENNNIVSSNNNEYIDITVEEAWEMLNDTSDGVQFPIDVRTDSEWINGHIDTPYPEYARHHNFYEWDDPEILNAFLTTYRGHEIIVYCRSGGRSVTASNILIDNGFDGIIYNMLGGITQWQSLGYPTVPNREPEKPEISGPSSGSPGLEIEFSITTDDPDYDKVYYLINWSDGSDELLIGPYYSIEDVKISHSWTETGIFIIKAIAIDIYDEESELTTFELSLSRTELEITSIKGSLGSVTVDIKNIGDNIAEEVSSVISVQGGFLSGINITHECSGCSACGTTLDPGNIKTEKTSESGFILGFGSIEISASAWANNAEKISKKASGFVFGPIVIIS
jgi:rhodanese-related sulfurtransferase